MSTIVLVGVFAQVIAIHHLFFPLFIGDADNAAVWAASIGFTATASGLTWSVGYGARHGYGDAADGNSTRYRVSVLCLSVWMLLGGFPVVLVILLTDRPQFEFDLIPTDWGNASLLMALHLLCGAASAAAGYEWTAFGSVAGRVPVWANLAGSVLLEFVLVDQLVSVTASGLARQAVSMVAFVLAVVPVVIAYETGKQFRKRRGSVESAILIWMFLAAWTLVGIAPLSLRLYLIANPPMPTPVTWPAHFFVVLFPLMCYVATGTVAAVLGITASAEVEASLSPGLERQGNRLATGVPDGTPVKVVQKVELTKAAEISAVVSAAVAVASAIVALLSYLLR